MLNAQIYINSLTPFAGALDHRRSWNNSSFWTNNLAIRHLCFKDALFKKLFINNARNMFDIIGSKKKEVSQCLSLLPEIEECKGERD